jgi:hypothetical protein
MAKRLYGVDPILRFNQKYIVNEETGCFEWTAALNNKGYGNFRVDDKIIKAHRFAYEYYNGPIDSQLEICHNCFNRKCVNYKHLRQDTRSSNMIDRSIAGNQNFQKLSVSEIIEIKTALKNPYRGLQKELAEKYNVVIQTINEIKMGRNWSHVRIP